MGRRIITSQMQAAGTGGKIDGFFDRVIKYIPADIVAAWIALTGLLSEAGSSRDLTTLWIAFFVMTGLTGVWTLRQTKEPGKPPAMTQTVLATTSFVVWVFALGGPFASLPIFSPKLGSVVLILYSIGVGAITPKE